jgi:AcrR family transcriptional regulator
METVRARHPRHEPVQDRGRRTREQVLLAARRILVRRGYEAARVEEITRLARVGYGTFYKYFRNKQDVLEAVMDAVYRDLDRARFPARVEAARLEDHIRAGLTDYLAVYHRNREVLRALQPAALMSPRIRELLAGRRERDVQWMLHELRKLADQGWQIPGSLEVFSVAMLSMVDAVAQDWITRRAHLGAPEVAGTLCAIWFRTILPARPD